MREEPQLDAAPRGFVRSYVLVSPRDQTPVSVDILVR